MRNHIFIFTFLCAVLAVACGDDDPPPPPVDAGGTRDTGDTPDAGDPGDSGGMDAGDTDSGTPARMARLVVGDSTGLSVFFVEDIDEDEVPTPDVSVAIAAGAADLATRDDRLFVAHASGTDAVTAYDEAWSLTSAATAASSIPDSALGTITPSTNDLLVVDSSGALWVNANFTDPLSRFAGATSGSLPATATATFSHPFGQIAGLGADPVGDRLFAGQISGAGIQGYETVSARTGDVTPDFTVEAGCSSWTMTVAGSRLYAACAPNSGAEPSTIGIWNDVNTLGATRAPDVTLQMDGTGTGSSVWDVLVADDTLFVGGEAGFRLWRDASEIATPRPADESLDIGSVRELAHASDGTVFALKRQLSGGTVAMIRDVATTPVVWTTLDGFDTASAIVVLQ